MSELTTTHHMILRHLAAGGVLEEDAASTIFLRSRTYAIIAKVKLTTLEALLEVQAIVKEERAGWVYYTLSPRSLGKPAQE